MIVGTAGHIDHGKTTLVRALTGVDTDRLPEEKARGISIELGYAYLDVPEHGERIGFIDVPGHEKLVHTMLAGASGIAFALLLVAADDGVMPQTREHLAVLSLLGLTRGAVAITKADRADPARIDTLRGEIRALLAGTGLDAAPILTVSAHTGQGLAELRELLFDAARRMPPRATQGLAARLAVDRAFSLDGVGTVVTGTLHAGEIAVGDELTIQGHRARVRSLHAQNQAVERARAGQRCAVALAGLAREQAPRGAWLTVPHVALATERLDARIHLWPGETRPLRSGTRVHLHLGAQSAMASLAVLDGEALEPGASARVQLVCHAP
ncbi:MAG TPA: selenocysteine-specific translation elongation factor, partial [Roseateles sp.]